MGTLSGTINMIIITRCVKKTIPLTAVTRYYLRRHPCGGGTRRCDRPRRRMKTEMHTGSSGITPAVANRQIYTGGSGITPAEGRHNGKRQTGIT
jgi:hypothetical protein